LGLFVLFRLFGLLANSGFFMAVCLGKYSQSLCISAQKYMLCAKILAVLCRNRKIFVVLRRNLCILAQKLLQCAEMLVVCRKVDICAQKYIWLQRNFYYMRRSLLTDLCGAQKYYQVPQKLLFVCRNYYLCVEIIGSLARIFWLPTILGMPWCCG
jgi:hypothetical protein